MECLLLLLVLVTVKVSVRGTGHGITDKGGREDEGGSVLHVDRGEK